MLRFTCLNCHVRFPDAEAQRLHYKTDWHRYNLKRRMIDLFPVSAENFERLLTDQRNAEKFALEDKSLYCRACKKLFKTPSTHGNHLNSKKHTINVEKLFLSPEHNEDDPVTIKATGRSSKQDEQRPIEATSDDEVEIEEVDSDEWDEDFVNPIDNNDCLFCEHHSKSLVANLKHMSIEHSFFIPDTEYCCDVNGLLSYLAEKICRDFICIWCNERGRTFYSLQGVRKHMRAKGHCKMLHEGAALAEYVDFYDYSSSYPDHDENKDLDEEIETPVLEPNEYQLRLPSGIVVGHRSLLKFYKQRRQAPGKPSAVKKSDRRLHKVLAEYRAIGWSVAQEEEVRNRAKDIHAMKRHQAKLLRQQAKAMQQLSLKSTNRLQRNFRPQMNH